MTNPLPLLKLCHSWMPPKLFFLFWPQWPYYLLLIEYLSKNCKDVQYNRSVGSFFGNWRIVSLVLTIILHTKLMKCNQLWVRFHLESNSNHHLINICCPNPNHHEKMDFSSSKKRSNSSKSINFNQKYIKNDLKCQNKSFFNINQ